VVRSNPAEIVTPATEPFGLLERTELPHCSHDNGEVAMKNWFSKLIALLSHRKRTQSPQCMDWRGRPMAETTGGAIPSVSLSERALYATLCLPSFDLAQGAELDRAAEHPRTPRVGEPNASAADNRALGGDSRMDTRASGTEHLPALEGKKGEAKASGDSG
jgi:hypothetical protein